MSDDASTTFLRQRRDLFVVSTILLLIPIAQIKIADSISMQQFGISMKIGKPEVLTYSLWALWFYWYLRYFQAYRKTSKYYFIKAMRDNTYNLAYKKFLKETKNQSEEIFEEYAEKTEINFSEITIHQASINNHEINLLEACFTWNPQATVSYRVSTIILDEKKLEFKGLRYQLMKMRALFSLFFDQMDFTEYYFPFIFGALPALYWLYTHNIFM